MLARQLPHGVASEPATTEDSCSLALHHSTIVLAEIDPLRSGGELLGKKLKDSKVSVETKSYAGVAHEFFGMSAVVEDAKDAMSFASKRLRASLGT